MKNLIITIKGKIILTMLLMSIAMISCKDYLEVTPKERVSDQSFLKGLLSLSIIPSINGKLYLEKLRNILDLVGLEQLNSF